MYLKDASQAVHFLLVWSFLLPVSHEQTPPNFLPSTSNTFNVKFNENIEIFPGKTLQPHEASSVPTLTSPSLNKYEPYIAIMLDTEIIDSRTAYTMLHWYRADLWAFTLPNTNSQFPSQSPRHYILHNLTSTPTSIAPYIGPQPRPGPPHTYIILLFQQPLNFRFPSCYEDMLPLTLEARKGFDLRHFLDVSGIGRLVAANYFLCQEEGSRPTSTLLKGRACETWLAGRRNGEL